ncbi:F0F1-type ATP synthase membrane subunit c/vacuolar-type H+-ATPase subunit K [Bhargavaea ullalensis]|uniref:F0F1-type ATP synthase membrane subunit c/vacuolar-type H+-ATPase subunit K n=1 Tax=Bhargavaea ullalensis TaxID=1265685 RepID=A0ABV2G8U6_9BACL
MNSMIYIMAGVVVLTGVLSAIMMAQLGSERE